jgi:hypothetical protein
MSFGVRRLLMVLVLVLVSGEMMDLMVVVTPLLSIARYTRSNRQKAKSTGRREGDYMENARHLLRTNRQRESTPTLWHSCGR